MAENKDIIRKKILNGYVISIAPDKTITIRVDRRKKDKRYKKYVTVTKKYMAHDEKNDARTGDFVRIKECRPLSKMKKWRLIEILERAK